MYEPYIGAKQNGIKGGGIGVFKGLGGFVYRPLRGCFEFIAHPVVGMIRSPFYIYKRIKVKKDPTDVKQTNFKIFGLSDDKIT